MRSDCPICSCSSCEQVFSITISQRSESPMDGVLNVMKCVPCSFYFTKSKSTEADYTKYYSTHNNYAGSSIACEDMNRCTAEFLISELGSSIKTVIDYGAGAGGVSKLLSSRFAVTPYDIGYEEPSDVYDCLVLSHVLEHIYTPKAFVERIERLVGERDAIARYVHDDGLVYIEVPDASRYHKMGDLGMLQEINIEHINFFSPYALSKLMVQSGYTPVSLNQYVSCLKSNEYHVIRGVFRKTSVSTSFESYIQNGQERIDALKDSLPDLKGRVFVYGCGQFLYKIINLLQNKYTIECIIDDNPNFKGNVLNTLPIVSLDSVRDSLCPLDNVLLCVGALHRGIILDKLNGDRSGLNIVTL